MRKICALTVVLLGVITSAQAQVLGEPIVVWDFANGITPDWQTGINSTTDLARWEYRGPNTIPDITVGARGSCSLVAQPIPSVTQSNGFIIFDGNYWDDPGNACVGNVGSGTDPGPHTTWIITPSVDLSATNGAVLTFQQQYRTYQAFTRVDITTDEGNNWTTIISNPYGTQSPQVAWASADISTLVAGQSNVRFRFYYSGFYYWWLLDDITVYEPNDNDLMISNVRYTNHNELNFEAPFIDLEYDQYPIPYISEFNFGATATNVGYNPQTNAYLNIRIVQDGETEIYNDNTPDALVDPEEIQNLLMPEIFTNPAEIGDYEIYFEVIQDQEDETPWNNVDSLDYSITNFAFARDEGPMETSYAPNNFYDTYRMEAGTFYEAMASGMACHSLQVAVAQGTALNSEIYGVIYNQSFTDTIAYTETYTINQANLNSVGDEKMITLHFTEPVILQDDSVYFAAISQVDSTQAFVIARSGNALGESALVRFPSVNATFISLKFPMVRMNIFPANATTGCTDPEATNYTSGVTEDGSCIYVGCSDPSADNYNPMVNFDDDSCIVGGCFDPDAENYNPDADYDNGTCNYPGCTDPTAVNYEEQFNIEDGSCIYLQTNLQVSTLSGCAPYTIRIENLNEFVANSSCSFLLNGDPINQNCESEFEYTINTPGEYELNYTFYVNSAVADTTVQITVFELPSAPQLFYDATNYEVICSNCGSNDYQWYFGSTPTGVSNISQSIFFQDNYQNGYYYADVIDSNGCFASSSGLLVVQPRFITNVTEACLPLSLTAYNLSDELPGTTYTIDFGDGTPPANFTTEMSHTYTNALSYDIVVTAQFNTTSGSYQIPVQVNPVIIPNLVHNSATDEVSCMNSNLFEELIWNIDGNIQNGEGPFPDNGINYSVTGITADGCSGSAVIVLTGLEETPTFDSQIYPVPASDQLFIKISSEGNFDLKVFDLTGRLMLTRSLNGSGTLNTVDTSELKPGVYLVEMTNGKLTSSSTIQILK